MPEIFNLFGFSFFFYSKEHLPIHVHVEGKDGHAVFDWDEESETFVHRECFNIKANDLRKIKGALAERKFDVFNKWNKHFNQ